MANVDREWLYRNGFIGERDLYPPELTRFGCTMRPITEGERMIPANPIPSPSAAKVQIAMPEPRMAPFVDLQVGAPFIHNGEVFVKYCSSRAISLDTTETNGRIADFSSSMPVRPVASVVVTPES
ncbi:hypothetical protein [Burkholderia phage vB_BglM_WTB]